MKGGKAFRHMKQMTMGVWVAIWILICCPLDAHAAPGIVYTMINVSGQHLNGDAHLMKFANGQAYVIDTGNEGSCGGGKIISFLKKGRINQIDKLFISHAHRDHYGGLTDLLNSSIAIREIYFNIPDKEACNQERPWGCDYEHVMNLRRSIEKRGIKLKTMQTGDLYRPNGDATLKVLFVQNGMHPEMGRTDINDTSALMKLIHGNQSVLFAGDLNWKAGEYVTARVPDLKADILKVPHHGTEGVATNSFFDAVQPRVAMVPSLTAVWISERSRRIREYFYSRNIPVYTSGLDGDVSVSIWKDGYKLFINQ
jgi:competence protein ComEC